VLFVANRPTLAVADRTPIISGVISLPIDEILSSMREALGRSRSLVLTAPPGAGKSTRVPPAVAALVPGKVYLLQPRRLAAKALAERIASENGWKLGREVGYRVRFDRVGAEATKLWVMTEGTLTRQLAADPYLDGVSAVIVDEFHERSLHTDLAVSYLRELQRTVRADLTLVVMSATMATAPVAAFLGGCPVLAALGRPFPVDVRHWPGRQDLPLADQVAQAVAEALADPDGGDLLVFLPGMGEIRACQRAVGPIAGDAWVLPLHGSLSGDEQAAALQPNARRKIVLATNVAETSVTIPGVRTVIDAGQARVLRYHPATGLDELRLEPISHANATQRAGRAGRTAPGRCLRLWTPLADHRLAEAVEPEVRRVDLAPMTLTLKRLGYDDTRTFPWFEPPEAERVAAAERLLHLLGATAAPRGPLTALGERLADLPLHPRLGRLLVEAAQAHRLHLGATLAALVAERDVRLPRRRTDPPVDPGPADALDRLEALAMAIKAHFRPQLRDQGIDGGTAAQVARAREAILAAWRGAPGGRKSEDGDRAADPDLICRLLLAAYPDRVARRTDSDPNRATMTGGVAVEIDRASALFSHRGMAREPLLVCVEIQETAHAGKPVVLVRQAAEITEADLERLVPGAIRREEALRYDAGRERVISDQRWLYRDLVIRSAPGQPADASAASACLAEALTPQAREVVLGEADAPARSWLARLDWLRSACPELGLPVFSDADFTEVLRELADGCASLAELRAKPALDWLKARLTRDQQLALDEHAPAELPVPSGRRIALDYAAAADRPPVLAVRLQELFGLATTPRLARGRVPVLLHLLAPNFRVEQVTQDLASFWAVTYPQVRKDLRARYPKHSWPDDPLTAKAEAKGRRRQGARGEGRGAR
jgi:ATP-dependent helicase HrpB